MIINAVIVTYNRKELLLRCLEAVLQQSQNIENLYLIDNASTDGTEDFLVNKGLITNDQNLSSLVIGKTSIHYKRLAQNSGGAGGFHEGMRLAHANADYVWIMDDDGYPSRTCLEKLLVLKDTYEYIMPVSLCEKDGDRLTWFTRKKNKRFTRSYLKLRNSFNAGKMRYTVPFNGLLLSRQAIEKVGFPKKEMFIWGDDFEYQYRCIKKGIEPITNLDAIFYHPDDKATVYRVFFGAIPVNYTESKLRFTCLIRNSTYNYWNYRGKYIIFLKFILYTWLFLIEKKFAIKDYIHYLKCVADGIKGDFTRHLQFLE